MHIEDTSVKLVIFVTHFILDKKIYSDIFINNY